jgi:hypothetical protein
VESMLLAPQSVSSDQASEFMQLELVLLVIQVGFFAGEALERWQRPKYAAMPMNHSIDFVQPTAVIWDRDQQNAFRAYDGTQPRQDEFQIGHGLQNRSADHDVVAPCLVLTLA